MCGSTDENEFVFVDESGNFDFTEGGTRHFVLSAHITRDPIGCGISLLDLTYRYLAEDRADQIPFHATENSIVTRAEFISALCGKTHHCEVISVWVEKRLLPVPERTPEALYSRLALVLAEQLPSPPGTDERRRVFLFDKSLTKRQQSPVVKILKSSISRSSRRNSIQFRPVSHDVNGQIADYYAWALFRSLERSDDSWLAKLPGPHRVQSAN